MSPRLAYLLQRLVQLPFVLVVVTISVFALIHVTPGDPIQIMLGMQTSPEAVAALSLRSLTARAVRALGDGGTAG